MRKIVVVGTGGTIASRTATPSSGAVAADGAADILRTLEFAGGLPAALTVGPQAIRLEAVDAVKGNSYNFTFGDLQHIAATVHEQLADPETLGIVVTHGTDLIEETAFLLDLTRDDERPIVVTGAQHTADSPEYDGPANLRDAILVACSPAARGMGALIVFAGRVFLARGTYKTHTLSLSPFRSFTAGQIGRVSPVEDGPSWLVLSDPADRWPRCSVPLPLPGCDWEEQVRVDLYPVYPGVAEDLLQLSIERCRAIVVCGTGAGNAPKRILPLLRSAVEAGRVICLSTRVPSGPVREIYGNGGGVDLVGAGVIPMGGLPASQCRVLAGACCYGVDSAVASRRVRDYVAWFGEHVQRRR